MCSIEARPRRTLTCHGGVNPSNEIVADGLCFPEDPRSEGKPQLHGQAILVRHADDLGHFGLTIHPDKTRLRAP